VKIIKVVLSVIVFTFLILVLVFFYFAGPTSLSDEKIRFVVPLEPNQDEVMKDLQKQGFIRSPWLFRFIASIQKYPGAIEPGAYELTHRMFLWQLTDILMFHPYQRWIILVPGLRKEQVADRLSAKFYWQQDKLSDFMKNAKEGFLYPDTYLLNIDYTGKEFAARLMNNFNEHITTKMFTDLQSQNVRLDTAVKIASLIERESGDDQDKPLIAGIIWNRLNKGMKLQLDAANQYVIGTKENWWPVVTHDDLAIDSPYNLYLYKGLPPTAIANPGLASINAAIYSQETDCLYYLHDHNKQIHCSPTYEGHLRNIEEYLN
jgi:UPF0755 protein